MRRLAVWVVVLLVATLVAPTAAGSATPSMAVGGPLIVRFDPASSLSERSEDLADRGLRIVDELPGSDVALAVPIVGARPRAGGVIEEIRPQATYRAMGVPDDPAFDAQWHLPAIDAVSAWDTTVGTGTVVAVLDTGIAFEDFGSFRRAPDFSGTAFVAGWDFVDDDGHPNDENGHGTHVASTIASTTNNGYGVASVAPGVTLMPIRVLDENGDGGSWALAQGLRFAADRGADIANLSLGSDTATPDVADAVAYARSRGVTIVAASGNGDENGNGGPVSSPARMDGVIAVGAVRYDLTRSSYSNFGAELDLVAPGGDLSVDQNHDGYGDGILQEAVDELDPSQFPLTFRQGTSMATPQVSAVAALVHAAGATSPEQIEQILTATAVDLGPAGRDDHYGKGMVQSGAAVRSLLLNPSSAQGIENACPSESTPPAPFTDLEGNVHQASVSCVAWWEVATGKTADTYEPNGSMTRAQLASFVARELEAAGLALPEAPPDAFTDDDTSVHELRINQLAALGVVNGKGGGLYAPGATVTRAEMATFLVRAHDQVASEPLPDGPDAFSDDNTSVHEPNINKVAAAGLAAGTSASRFSPKAAVLRGQMATFLARLLDRLVETGATAAR